MTRKLFNLILAISVALFIFSCSSGQQKELTDAELDQQVIGELGDVASDELNELVGDISDEDVKNNSSSNDIIGGDDLLESDDIDLSEENFDDFAFEENSEDLDFGDESELDSDLVQSELSDIENDFSEDVDLGEELGSEGFEQELSSDVADIGFDESFSEVDVDEDLAFEAESGPIITNPIQINKLEYLSFQDGGSVILESEEPVPFTVEKKLSLNQVIIRLSNVILPASLQRPYITKEFQQKIASINAYQETGSSDAIVVVQYSLPVVADINQNGSSISLKTIRASSSLQVISSNSDIGIDGLDTLVDPENNIDNQANLETENESSLADSGSKYTGKRISIEVNDVPVKSVLDLISDEVGVNLIVDDKVTGNISVKLKEVPWDKALMLILRSKGLDYLQEDSVIRVSTIAGLKAEEKERYERIQSQIDNEELFVKVFPVNFAKAADLVEKIKSQLTKRGKVVADERTGTLVVTDVRQSLDRADKLIKALDLAPYQVLIEAKIVEARRSFIRRIGVTSVINGVAQAIGGGADLTPTLGIEPTSPGVFADGLRLGLTAATFKGVGDLSAFLGLHERDQLVRVVSSPRIMTLNNQEAEIRQVTQIPIIEESTSDGGTTSSSVEFKDLELSLKVTPQITFNGNIILQVEVKREFAGAEASGAGGAREINSREAKTSVLVENGKTAVIGGIYQSDAINEETGVPYLKNIPILGNLFKSRGKIKEKNELLLFLNPQVINVEQHPISEIEADEKGMAL